MTQIKKLMIKIALVVKNIPTINGIVDC